MIKQVIKFKNGDYWCNYTTRLPILLQAWTFNRVEGAQETIKNNNLADCEVLPVEVEFTPFYKVKSMT